MGILCFLHQLIDGYRPQKETETLTSLPVKEKDQVQGSGQGGVFHGNLIALIESRMSSYRRSTSTPPHTEVPWNGRGTTPGRFSRRNSAVTQHDDPFKRPNYVLEAEKTSPTGFAFLVLLLVFIALAAYSIRMIYLTAKLSSGLRVSN